MKTFGAIIVLCATLALIGCGEDSSSGQPERPEKITKPTIEVPPGPLPKEVVVKDIWEGSGPGTEVGDRLTIHYLGVNGAGKEEYSSWVKRGGSPLTFTFGKGIYNFPGWVQGLKGMQKGDRRELFIPAPMAYGKPLFYIVDLLKLE